MIVTIQHKIAPAIPTLEELKSHPEASDWVNYGERIAEAYLQMTSYLLENRSPHIRKLVLDFVKMVETGITPIAYGHSHIIQFVGANKQPNPVGFALFPFNWYVMAERNPFFEMGEIVTVACRARDFHNGVFFIDPLEDKNSPVWRRGEAYEAEFLLHPQNHHNFPMSPSQKRLLQLFPKGVESDPSLGYDPKPV